MTCVYCPKPIKDTDVYWDLSCGRHLAHGDHGTTRCTICTRVGAPIAQPVSDLPPPPQAAVQSEAVVNASRQRRLAQNAARRKEPLKPYDPAPVTGWFTSVLRVAGRLSEASIPDDESEDPVALLDAGVPLQTIVHKHGFDITEMINDAPGVTIADFFRNGYTIGEMCDAFASRMNREEGMHVLYCLGMTDEYLSARPQQSQVAIMKQRLGLNVENFIQHLEYKFVPGRWTLPQMLEVGLTMPVVMKLGMRTMDEWLQLKATATTESELFHFGYTPTLAAQLIPTSTTLSSPTTEQPHVVQSPVHAAPATCSPLSSLNAPVYGPVMPKQWPPPGMAVPPAPRAIANTSGATTGSSSSVKPPGQYSWGSKLPPDVFIPVAVPQQHAVQAPVAHMRDNAPRLVDKPPLMLLPQHQPAQTAKYALKK